MAHLSCYFVVEAGTQPALLGLICHRHLALEIEKRLCLQPWISLSQRNGRALQAAAWRVSHPHTLEAQILFEEWRLKGRRNKRKEYFICQGGILQAAWGPPEDAPFLAYTLAAHVRLALIPEITNLSQVLTFDPQQTTYQAIGSHLCWAWKDGGRNLG